MKLEDFIKLTHDTQTIVLYDNNLGWICTFPSCFVPSEYLKCEITDIEPVEFKGEGPGSGIVQKVWIMIED